jgi:uncharacterized membrane protein
VVGYFIAVPPIRIGSVSPKALNTVTPVVTAYESVSKTLTTEECKIIEVLNAHEGKYLQKNIRSEAVLSRLKTHRIITRLAERDIVTLEKTGIRL